MVLYSVDKLHKGVRIKLTGNVTGNVLSNHRQKVRKIIMSGLTIREIAKMAEVSVSTVSRVINGMPDVNEKTRVKVNNIICEYGYVPNASARTLKQNNTNIICIVVKGIRNPFFAPVVELMQSAIEQTKYIPVVHYIDESSDEVGVASQLLTEKKALGIVFLGGNPASKVRSLSRFRVPCVLSTMPPGNHDIRNVSSVCIDDNIAARSAAEYLLAKGHKKIAILGGRRMDRDLVWNRYIGAKSAIEEKGYVFDEKLYLESKFSLDDSYKAVKSALIEYHGSFTAIFAMSDIMAIGAMKAIFDSGASVPQDISVIGFDGIKFAEYYHPGLATVRQPYEEIAEKSIELLVSNIEGETTGTNITLETRIIEGESVFDINN